jgi:hypothetical protein
LPALNVFGELQDTSGARYNVEYMTIGGKYSRIPLYKEQKDGLGNPHANITYFDLDDIRTISPVINEEQPLVTYQGISYVPIEVTRKDAKDNSSEQFLIETTRKLTCYDISINQEPAVEKELSFQAIARLSIQASKPRDPRGRQPQTKPATVTPEPSASEPHQ